MAYATIDKGSKYFNTVLYTGTGATQSITGVGFQPDWVWTKSRSNAGYNNQVHDVIRGANKVLWTNLTNAEGSSDTNGFLSFQSDGFNLGADTAYTEVNVSGQTYASWNWLASNTTTSNNSGTITSTVSANTTSGFSIVSYTGNGTGGATVGHGLGVTPKMIIIKGRGTTYNWVVGHNSLSTNWGKYLTLSTTDAVETATNVFNDTAPTSSLFSIGTALGVNTSSSTYIAYCFAEVKGFSKFGSYTGNGSTDGIFIYTGFKPAFLIVKRYSSAGYDWLLYDNKRQVSFNVVDDFLFPSQADAEVTGNANQSLDFLSNGVKYRGLGDTSNGSGASYIYMAFAENPFVSSKGIPTTAR